jgi:hypothetical protein
MNPSFLPIFAPNKYHSQIMTNRKQPDASSGALYGMGVIGAAVYYVSHACGFWMGAFGILKALFWPAFLVYEALMYLGA